MFIIFSQKKKIRSFSPTKRKTQNLKLKHFCLLKFYVGKITKFLTEIFLQSLNA